MNLKSSKPMCQHECHEQYRESQDNRVPGLTQLETADAGQQDVSHNQVEHSPQDVDRRR